jgi:DNA repair exonuclease SbcCD ATPase subunit
MSDEQEPKKKRSIILDTLDLDEADFPALELRNRITALEAENARLKQENQLLEKSCRDWTDNAIHKNELITDLYAQIQRLTRINAHLTQTAADHCGRWSRAEGRERRAIQELTSVIPLIERVESRRYAFPEFAEEPKLAAAIRQALAALDAGAPNETDESEQSSD